MFIVLILIESVVHFVSLIWLHWQRGSKKVDPAKKKKAHKKKSLVKKLLVSTKKHTIILLRKTYGKTYDNIVT